MYKTVYEIWKFPIPWPAILGLLGTIVGISQILKSATSFKTFNATKQKQPKISTVIDGIVGAIAVLFFGFILIVYISNGGSDDYKFSKMYYSGEYECIEGKVTDFYKEGTTPNDISVESFMVNDVLFEYRDALRWAFQNFPRVITRNGQEVRIYYIHYRLGDVGDDWRNVIVRVDIKK